MLIFVLEAQVIKYQNMSRELNLVDKDMQGPSSNSVHHQKKYQNIILNYSMNILKTKQKENSNKILFFKLIL